MPDPQGNPTLLDLVAEIEDDIERADLSRQVRTAIDRAIRHYQPERLTFNERVLTFLTAPGVDTYARGDLGEIAELYAVDTLVLVENDQPWPLQRVAESDIECRQDAASQARPRRFSFFDRSLRVDPVPDAAYTLRLTGHVKIPAPAADGDTSPWVDEAGTLIAAWAKRHLAQNSLRDPALAQAQELAVREAFKALRARANRAASAGVIRAYHL